MATSITRVTINGATWTQISTVETSVLISNNVGQLVLIAASAADPTPAATNWVTVRDDRYLSLLSQSLALWARLADASFVGTRILEVVKS